MLVVEPSIFERNTHIEGAIGPVDLDAGDFLEKIVGYVGESLVTDYALLEPGGVLGMAEDWRNCFLWQGGRADFNHFRVVNTLNVALEHRVFVDVVNFDPATA